MAKNSGEILLTEAVFGSQKYKKSRFPEKRNRKDGSSRKKKRLLRLLLSIFLGTVVVLVLFLSTVGLYVYVNRDEIKQLFVREINKSLKSPVSVQSIGVGIFREFPMVSVSFEGIEGQPADAEDGESLFYAERISLTLNIRDLLRKRYVIREILVRGGDFNLKHYGSGRYNYIIWEKSAGKENPVEFHLRRILLRNTLVRYRDLPARHDFQVLARSVNARGDLYENGQDFQLKGDILVHAMKASGFLFLSNKKAGLEVSFGNDGKKKDFTIQKGKISLGNLDFGVQGYVHYRKAEPYLEFDFSGNALRLGSMLALFPEEVQNRLNEYGFSGKVDFQMNISGDYTQSPLSLYARFDYSDGKIRHKPSRIEASKVYLVGDFTNGHARRAETARLHFEQVSASLPSGSIEGKFSINNFKIPEIDYEGSLSADISELQDFFRLFPAYRFKGHAQAELSYRNRFPSLSPRTWKALDFGHSQATGYLRLDGLDWENGEGDLLHIDTLWMDFSSKTVKTRTFRLQYGRETVELKLFVDNFLPYLVLPQQNLYLSASLQAPSLDLEKWIRLGDAFAPVSPSGQTSVPADTTRNGRRGFLSDLVADVRVKVDAAFWKDLRFEHIGALLRYTPDDILLEDLTLRAFQGGFSGSASLQHEDGKNAVRVEGNINQMDISSCFKGFKNFGQDQITYRNIGGTLTSDLRFQGVFDERRKWDPASIDLWSDLTVRDGVLQNMENLKKISRFTGENDLQHIRFADLHTVVEIYGKCIRIHQLDVVSDAANLSFVGTHTFDNEVDYLVNIELSDLLSRRRAQRLKDENEFGVVSKDKTRVRLPLTIRGKMPDVEIRYAMSEAKKGAKQRLVENRRDFKTALQEDFYKARQKRLERKAAREEMHRRENGEFVIETEETGLLKRKNGITRSDSTVKKKYDTREDFRIEFEDD